ncbi:MAG: 23S rRNA (adenine1618-N6)-methyltransferase [Bacteroidia bacterium]
MTKDSKSLTIDPMSKHQSKEQPKIKGSAQKIKPRLHSRNRHRTRYDFKALIGTLPALAEHVSVNEYGDESIDFFDPNVVKLLNTALLMNGYEVKSWDIPKDYLCPPIPGRADYIHHVADVIGTRNDENSERLIPIGPGIKCLDIGVGANCIYPIIGNYEYGWSFVGTEIDPIAIEAANAIINANESLKGSVKLRLQKKSEDIFYGAIKKGETFDIAICNPPFHASLEEAIKGTVRKLSNLKGKKVSKPILNFGGQTTELWTEGGEERFIRDMIIQSKQFADSVYWFSTLVSKQSHLKDIYASLKKIRAIQVKTIPMGQGNKSSRIVMWSYMHKREQENWRQKHWKETKSFPIESAD